MHVTDGTYVGKVFDSGFTLTKTNKEMAFMVIDFKTLDGSTAQLTWWGSLVSDSSRQYVLKTLSELNPEIKGWQDVMSGKKVAKGTEVKLTIENQANPRTQLIEPKVKWVNRASNKVDPRALSFLSQAPTPTPEDDSLPF